MKGVTEAFMGVSSFKVYFQQQGTAGLEQHDEHLNSKVHSLVLRCAHSDIRFCCIYTEEKKVSLLILSLVRVGLGVDGLLLPKFLGFH